MMEEEKKQMRTEQELIDIAIELIRSLKPMGLTVREIRKIADHIAIETEFITYGP